MKKEQISDAIGMLEDELIEETAAYRKRRRRKRRLIFSTASAACLCLAVILVITVIELNIKSSKSNQIQEQNTKGDEISKMENKEKEPVYIAAASSDYVISKASYPQMASYPDENSYGDYVAWKQDQKKQKNQPEGYKDGVKEFSYLTMKQFLSAQGDKNCLCSPINLYMALGILAESCDNNSRSQILNVLRAEDIETLRMRAKGIWNANYCSDGAVTSVLANSVWLNNGVQYNAQTMNSLAETYYASSFQGEMGSTEFNQIMQNWINEQTGGLLEEQASQIKQSPETILSLISTVYFKAKWENEFKAENTKKDIFYGANYEVSIDFMYRQEYSEYYQSEKFIAAGKELTSSGRVWFILPDENISLDELLDDKSILDFVMDTEKKCEDRMIHYYLPKFDISSDYSLIEGLQEMGITDVFDKNKSDFSPLLEYDKGVSITDALHAVRVGIDEEGCYAAAFTEMMAFGSGMMSYEEIEFRLNRPFLFIITGQDQLPMFAGVVNQPE